jgi:hypothetical protein
MTGRPAGSRRRGRFLLGFALYFVVLWALWDTPLLHPLQLFVVLLHEISHGIVAIATGGTIVSIGLTPGQGGYCQCPGGNAFLTLSAGYLGSLGWGVLLLEIARRAGRRSAAVVAVLGGLVLALTLLTVRNVYGLLFGLLFGVGLVVVGRRLDAGVNRILLTALGLTSALYAILDIKSDVLDRPHLPSDAAMLAELTGVPTLVWGVLWIGIALGVCALLLRREWRRM